MQTGMIFFKFPAKNKTFKLNGKIPKICNLSSEFVHYKSLIDRLDSASAMSYWKLIGCIPRCSYTKYSLNVLWDSNFDLLGSTYIPYFQNHKPQVGLLSSNKTHKLRLILKSNLFQNRRRDRFSICFPPSFEFLYSDSARKGLLKLLL